ncbi:MAG: response regulator, partial [Devosia sp.]|nr:response regulator [Devosia sp.]
MAMQNGQENALCGRLLLVDKDAETGRRTGESLCQAMLVPPQVSIATCGREAAELLRQTRFDVIVADMPSLGDLGENGEEAMGRLVRLAEGALVLAMADGASVSAAVGAMRVGAHDYVAKPV